jgi:hypothetical protein
MLLIPWARVRKRRPGWPIRRAAETSYLKLSWARRTRHSNVVMRGVAAGERHFLNQCVGLSVWLDGGACMASCASFSIRPRTTTRTVTIPLGVFVYESIHTSLSPSLQTPFIPYSRYLSVHAQHVLSFPNFPSFINHHLPLYYFINSTPHSRHR